MKKLHFDTCFDDDKLAEFAHLLPDTYRALNELAPWRKGKWPVRVRCMTNKQVVSGRRRGAGHGMTYVRGSDSKYIWMNPHMSVMGLWLVLIHENLHHAFPDATEEELNNVLVPFIYEDVTGKKLDKKMARKHGLGPPQPGIGDRGYVK
jgi:hypothetical protein